MIPRALASTLREAARSNPIVTVTGPRQSGKTTLVREVFGEHAYTSLEDPDVRAFALEDPRGFLAQYKDSVVLDEVQRVPSLFSYIQTAVDELDRMGRFILSGSQNFLLLRSVSQSLAGRTAILHLLPFSLSELHMRLPLEPATIGREGPPEDRHLATDLMETLFRGSYPRIHDKGLDPSRWLADYYRTYVERDVREVTNVGDLETFGRFVRLCAGRNGQLLNLSSLANDAGVTHTTARRWISILQTSFIAMLLRPHHANFSKRLIKSPKLYFLDTGLLCYLLRIRSPEDLRIHAARGAVFEAFVLGEFLKNRLNRGIDADLFFWRDRSAHEIDLLLDWGGDLIPVEIKSGQTVTSDYFTGLRFWRELVADDEAPAAIVYGGSRSLTRNGVTVYSWSVL